MPYVIDGNTASTITKAVPTVAPKPVAPTTPKATYTAPKPLTSYSNDYQAEINRRTALNPNDPTISQLSALRQSKIASTLPPEGTQLPALQQETIMPPVLEQQQPDLTDTYNQISAAQLQSRMAALDKQLNNQLGNVNSQYAGVNQRAYNESNQAAAQADVGAMNFAQRAAARGMTGNAAAMPEIYRNNSLQGRLGGITNQKLSDISYLDNQKLNLQNNYESDLVAAQAGIQAESLQNYINQMNSDRSFGIQEAGVTGMYKGQQTYDGQQQQIDNQMAQLELEALQIKNSYLPETYKQEAQILQQQAVQGRISPSTALAQIQQIKTTDTSLDMAKVNNITTGFTSAAMKGDMNFIATQTLGKYQNGQLTRAEANYILDGFNLPTLD